MGDKWRTHVIVVFMLPAEPWAPPWPLTLFPSSFLLFLSPLSLPASLSERAPLTRVSGFSCPCPGKSPALSPLLFNQDYTVKASWLPGRPSCSGLEDDARALGLASQPEGGQGHRGEASRLALLSSWYGPLESGPQGPSPREQEFPCWGPWSCPALVCS